MQQHIYGARTEPIYQKLKKLNATVLSDANRLTLYNDAHIRTNDDEFTGKKNFRFIIGSTNQPMASLDGRIHLYTPYDGHEIHRIEILKALGPDLDWKNFNKHAAIGTAYMIFDSSDRAIYFVSTDSARSNVSSQIFLNANCDFSSIRFENSLELPKDVVYRLDYFNRQLIEVVDLGV